MALPIQDTDREATAKARFIDTMREKANLVSFMSAFTDETQALENALFQIFNGFNLNTAVGAQLDGIGEIVGLARQGASDDTYRIRLHARILINLSSGTPNEILRLVNLLFAPFGVTTQYRAYYPASLLIDTFGSADESVYAEVAAALFEIVSGGVQASLLFGSEGEANSFIFADSSSPQASLLQGFTDFPETTGGQFAGLIFNT